MVVKSSYRIAWSYVTFHLATWWNLHVLFYSVSLCFEACAQSVPSYRFLWPLFLFLRIPGSPLPLSFPLSLYTECIPYILKVIVMLGLGDLKMVDISMWNYKDIWAGRNSLSPYIISFFNLQISSLWKIRLSSHRQPQNGRTATFHPSMRHLETGFSKGVLGNLSLFSGL